MERLKLSDKFAPKQVILRSGTATNGEDLPTKYQEAAQRSRAAKLEQRRINREEKINRKVQEEDINRLLGLSDSLSYSQNVINNFNNSEFEEKNIRLNPSDEQTIITAITKADSDEKYKMDTEAMINQVNLQQTIELQSNDTEDIVQYGNVQINIGDKAVTDDKCNLNPLYPLEEDEEGDMSCDRNVEKLDDEPTGVILEGPTTPPSINQYPQSLSTENYNKLAYALTDYRPLSNGFKSINGTELQYPADLTNFIRGILPYINEIIKYKIKRPKGSSRNIKTLETYLQEKLTAVFKENSQKEKKERKKKKKNNEAVTDDEQVLNENIGTREQPNYIDVIYRNIFNIKDTDIHTWKEDLEDYIYSEYFDNNGNNIPVKLSSSLILLICYYGVQVINSNNQPFTIKTIVNGKRVENAYVFYKVIKPKGQAEKTVRVGSVAEFPEIVGCQYGIDQLQPNQLIPKSCTFSFRINSLFNTIENNIADVDTKYNVIKSILLWFDTHHDFKKTRFKDVVDYWFDLNPKRFIDYYADQFFTGIGTSNITFSPSVENTILAPVKTVDNNTGILASKLYTISVDHLREKDFEKTLLLIYITKYYLKPNAGKFNFNDINYPSEGKHFLRDILNVKKDDIKKLVDTERDKDTMNEGYLKTISDFYGYDFINARSFETATQSDAFPYNFNIDNDVGTFINNLQYVKDAGSSSYKLNKEKRKYVPSALFDGNPTNSKELGYKMGNALYSSINGSYNLEPNLKNTYTYKYNNDCKLNVSINTPNTIQKADIRCSKEGEDLKIVSNPFEKTTDITLKQRIETMLNNSNIGNRIRDKYTFSEKLLEVLKKFTSEVKGNFPDFANFAINGSGKPSELKYYFNNRDGPTVPDLMFVIIYTYILYNIEGKEIPLDVLDEILSLKRIGDYGQILDCKHTNLPLFTTDNMQCLISIFEKVSCFIDYSQGPGIIIYDGGNDSIMSREIFNNIIPRNFDLNPLTNPNVYNAMQQVFQNSYKRNPLR